MMEHQPYEKNKIEHSSDSLTLEYSAAPSFSLFKPRKVVFTEEQMENNLENQLSLVTQDDTTQQSQSQEREDWQDEEQGNNSHQRHQKTDLLYNPLEDDDNALWIRNNLHRGSNSRQTPQKALICPACFGQVCFQFKSEIGQASQTQGDSLKSIAKYVANEVSSLVSVNPGRVIRNTQVPLKMPETERSEGKLRDRLEEINVKLVIECQCGADIGYYDVNMSKYVLINVV